MIITYPQRKDLMLKMREARISDTQIAKVFGVKRQRVGQILGPCGPAAQNDPELDDKICQMSLDGVPRLKIGHLLGLTERRVYAACMKLSPEDKRKARRQRQFVKVKARLDIFAGSVTLGKFNTAMLMRYDAGLYQLATRLMTLDKWAEMYGLEYVRYDMELYGKAAIDATEDTYR